MSVQTENIKRFTLEELENEEGAVTLPFKTIIDIKDYYKMSQYGLWHPNLPIIYCFIHDFNLEKYLVGIDVFSNSIILKVPLYITNVGFAYYPAISKNAKYIGILSRNSVYIIELETGNIKVHQYSFMPSKAVLWLGPWWISDKYLVYEKDNKLILVSSENGSVFEYEWENDGYDFKMILINKSQTRLLICRMNLNNNSKFYEFDVETKTMLTNTPLLNTIHILNKKGSIYLPFDTDIIFFECQKYTSGCFPKIEKFIIGLDWLGNKVFDLKDNKGLDSIGWYNNYFLGLNFKNPLNTNENFTKIIDIETQKVLAIIEKELSYKFLDNRTLLSKVNNQLICFDLNSLNPNEWKISQKIKIKDNITCLSIWDFLMNRIFEDEPFIKTDKIVWIYFKSILAIDLPN